MNTTNLETTPIFDAFHDEIESSQGFNWTEFVARPAWTFAQADREARDAINLRIAAETAAANPTAKKVAKKRA